MSITFTPQQKKALARLLNQFELPAEFEFKADSFIEIGPGLEFDINKKDFNFMVTTIRSSLKEKKLPIKDFDELLIILFDKKDFRPKLKDNASKVISEFRNEIKQLYGYRFDSDELSLAVRVAEDRGRSIKTTSEWVRAELEILDDQGMDIDELESFVLDDIENYIFDLEQIQAEQTTEQAAEQTAEQTAEQAAAFATPEMYADQQTLDKLRTLDKQNNLIREQILKLNGNKVKDESLKYITQDQDIARYNRRMTESRKYFNDEAIMIYQLSQMANEQQYLTMQLRSNYLYGIPSTPGINNKDFFAT